MSKEFEFKLSLLPKNTRAMRLQQLLELYNTWVMGPNGRKRKILKKKDVIKLLKELDK